MTLLLQALSKVRLRVLFSQISTVVSANVADNMAVTIKLLGLTGNT
jgi:hypothetical protein